MTKKKVWRYYCDFCKKTGQSAGHMAKHEKHCTANPNRTCRVCDSSVPVSSRLLALKLTVGLEADPIKGHHEDKVAMDDATLDKLRSTVDGCPACMLSVIRQSHRYPDSWNYKQEHDAYWAERNSENASGWCSGLLK